MPTPSVIQVYRTFSYVPIEVDSLFFMCFNLYGFSFFSCLRRSTMDSYYESCARRAYSSLTESQKTFLRQTEQRHGVDLTGLLPEGPEHFLKAFETLPLDPGENDLLTMICVDYDWALENLLDQEQLSSLPTLTVSTDLATVVHTPESRAFSFQFDFYKSFHITRGENEGIVGWNSAVAAPSPLRGRRRGVHFLVTFLNVPGVKKCMAQLSVEDIEG